VTVASFGQPQPDAQLSPTASSLLPSNGMTPTVPLDPRCRITLGTMLIGGSYQPSDPPPVCG
jgi:hypothetical protein